MRPALFPAHVGMEARRGGGISRACLMVARRQGNGSELEDELAVELLGHLARLLQPLTRGGGAVES